MISMLNTRIQKLGIALVPRQTAFQSLAAIS